MAIPPGDRLSHLQSDRGTAPGRPRTWAAYSASLPSSSTSVVAMVCPIGNMTAMLSVLPKVAEPVSAGPRLFPPWGLCPSPSGPPPSHSLARTVQQADCKDGKGVFNALGVSVLPPGVGKGRRQGTGSSRRLRVRFGGRDSRHLRGERAKVDGALSGSLPQLGQHWAGVELNTEGGWRLSSTPPHSPPTAEQDTAQATDRQSKRRGQQGPGGLWFYPTSP